MVARGFQVLSLRIAASTRGLRLPCRTATTHSGFSSGAFFIGRISDQVTADNYEPQWPGGKLQPPEALVRKRRETIEPRQDLVDYPVSGFDAVTGNMFPDFVEIASRPRVNFQLSVLFFRLA
jgi:hypothetical protein